VKAQRRRATPFYVIPNDCELTTVMASSCGVLEGELRPDVQARLRLVVNAYEPHLARLNEGEPAGRCE
jgi:hypothetical protein